MRFIIVDAVNSPEVLSFYQKNDFVFLFTTELQEDLYTYPPRDDAERQERIAHPRHLSTRLMYFDILELKE